LESILKDRGPGGKIVLAQLAGDSWVVKLAKQYKVPSILRIPSFTEYICTAYAKFIRCLRPCLSGNKCPHRVVNRAVREASAVITSSYFAATLVKQFYDKDALVVYPSIDPEEHLVKKTGHKVTLINGTPVKGMGVLLKVAKKHKEFSYMVVRNPPPLDKSWKDYDIQLLPGRDDMHAVWEQTRILLVPSLVAESFGRVCVEAGINGIPVIASDRGGLPEAAGPAAVIPVEDIKAWQQEVYKLMTDSKYYATRSASAREHATQFDVVTSTDRFARLAEELLAGREAAPLITRLNKSIIEPSKVPRVALFGPWIGEFGWEVATWQPWCRKQARKYDKVYVCSFPGMGALYEDFAEFVPHSYPRREVLWTLDRGVDLSKVAYNRPADVTTLVNPIWEYRIDGEFIKFGKGHNTQFGCLIHAAKHLADDKLCKNYPEKLWREIVAELPGSVASIGTGADLHIAGTVDRRGIPLNELMDLMAGCRVVVGGSSGPMHLAAFCGAAVVVWGPRNASFEPLNRRYTKAWNPFGTRVEYIFADDWKPLPAGVVSAVRRVLENTS